MNLLYGRVARVCSNTEFKLCAITLYKLTSVVDCFLLVQRLILVILPSHLYW